MLDTQIELNMQYAICNISEISQVLKFQIETEKKIWRRKKE